MNFLQMTPHQFDQTDSGWRSLDHAGEYLKAAQLIVDYIQHNKGIITTNPSLQTLYFHAGQEYATAGTEHYTEATDCLRKSYKKELGWDLYVEGSIAFLERDEARLQNAIKMGSQNPEILKRFLKALQQQDYSYKDNY